MGRPRDFRPTILPQFGIVFACSTTTGPKIFIVSRWTCFKQAGAGKARSIVSSQLHPFEMSSTRSKSFNPGLVFNPAWRHQTPCGFTLAGNRIELNSPWIMMIILFSLILPSVKDLFTYFPLVFFEKIRSDEYHKMYPGRLKSPETHPYSNDEPGVISIMVDYSRSAVFRGCPYGQHLAVMNRWISFLGVSQGSWCGFGCRVNQRRGETLASVSLRHTHVIV